MKVFSLLVFTSLIVCCRISFGQITLEHVYDHGGGGGTIGTNQLFMVNFEEYGLHYVKIDRTSNKMLLYDLNHILTKTISIPSSVFNNDDGFDLIMYISQHLFDTDDGIEYMIANWNFDSLKYSTYIVDEDGSLLLSKPNQYPWVASSIPPQQFPIYNTPNGTKLILSSVDFVTDSAYVYSLPGTLSTFIQEQNNSLLQQMNSSSVYPNPSNQVSTIEYEIAPSDLPATLKIYDATGKQIASASINSVKGKIEIPLSGFSSGAYEYQIQSGAKTLSSGKFIVSQ